MREKFKNLSVGLLIDEAANAAIEVLNEPNVLARMFSETYRIPRYVTRISFFIPSSLVALRELDKGDMTALTTFMLSSVILAGTANLIRKRLVSGT